MLKDLSFMSVNSQIPEAEKIAVEAYVHEFENRLDFLSQNMPPRIARYKLSGSVFIFIDPDRVLIYYAPKQGNTVYFGKQDKPYIPSKLHTELTDWHDYTDLSIAVLPLFGMNASAEQKKNIIESAALDLINRTFQQANSMTEITTFSPIFGPNKYPVQEKLVFIIMPFNKELDEIYKSIIKPCVEDDIKFVARRADEITSSKPIMEDIWKSICESKLIIADMTGFNPNVMYELGIAHTLGKSTILIHQDSGADQKFPFDLSHIRRINYTNTATGGQALRNDLLGTINSIITFGS